MSMGQASANKKGTKRKLPPHLWKKGQSGNPTGRPKSDPEIKAAMRAGGEKALTFLSKLLQDEGAKDADRLKAAIWLAERAFGRAHQTSDVTVRDYSEEEGKQITGRFLRVIAAQDPNAVREVAGQIPN